jgi:hypothetical protein
VAVARAQGGLERDHFKHSEEDKIMSKRIVFGIVGVAMTLSGLALAATDAKYFVGSACSFSDSPLSAHSKADHLFRNTSGVERFGTCPIVRENGPNSIESANIDMGGPQPAVPQSVRMEQRPAALGGVSGWAPDTTTVLSGGLRYNYCVGSANCAPVSGASLAFEPLLPHNGFVSTYRVDELI